ncbi:hypothetical protein ACH5RR_014142 [Cinchona calisaya]|uniref:Transposase n=1 Tax=Cinchona calisaya TaxID=153742 RepID=A0ABD3A204_9GENT
MEDSLIYILCENDAKDLATYGLSCKLIDVFFIHQKTFLLIGFGSVSSTQRVGLDTGIEKRKNNAPHNLPQTTMTAPTIDIDMVNSGSQNRQARRKHLPRRKHVARKQGKSPFKKACRGNQKKCEHVGISDDNFAAENLGTKEDKNGETTVVDNVDTNADYFDANNTAKIAEITENAGAKSGANSKNVDAENAENTGAENATNVDNTKSVGAKNAENADVEIATNGENACAVNNATRQAKNPNNAGSVADLNTHPSQDTTTEPNAGTTIHEHVGEPTNVIGGSLRKNHGPKKKVSRKDKGKKVMDDVVIDDSSDAESFHDSDYMFEDKIFYQTDGEGEAANFDELDNNESACEDDSDITVQRRKHLRLKPKIDMDDPKFVLGLLFGTKEEFKKACIHHGVKWGRKIRFKKNDNRRIMAICKNNKWYVSAAKMKGTTNFQIKSMMIRHSCARTIYYGLASLLFLCEKYKEDIRMIPNWKVSDFQTKVHNDLNVSITRNQAYLTKKKAEELIKGDYTEQYKSLHDYVAELLRSNLGSNVFLTTQTSGDDDEVFQRFYVCLQACKEGFLAGCKPIVGLDGCHLRGPHKGILLSAVGIDPNDQLYRIAYAVVEIENKRTWGWFVEELLVDLQIRDQAHWIFITDKQKGLIQASSDLLPGVEHRLCVRHIYNNLKNNHSGLALKDRIWAIAKASCMNLFAYHMEQLKDFDSAAYKWLIDNTNPKHWSRSHFRAKPKCDILLNNLCEKFNLAILEAKEKPILGLLETIRHYLMANTPLRYKCSLCHEHGHNMSSCGVSAADLHASYQTRIITRDAPATHQPAAMILKKSVEARSSKSGVAVGAALSMSAKHFVQHPDAQDYSLRYVKDRT